MNPCRPRITRKQHVTTINKPSLQRKTSYTYSHFSPQISTYQPVPLSLFSTCEVSWPHLRGVSAMTSERPPLQRLGRAQIHGAARRAPQAQPRSPPISPKSWASPFQAPPRDRNAMISAMCSWELANPCDTKAAIS